MYRRWTILLVATLVVQLGAVGSAPSMVHAADVTPGAVRTVTLITGDRVSMSGGAISVHPGPGRADIPMLTSMAGGHTQVVPADALPLVRADRLDARLFDVTGLLEAGYDDRRGDLPLIAGDTAGLSGTVVRRLTSLRAIALSTPKRDLGRLWSAKVQSDRTVRPGKVAGGKIWLDAVGRFSGAEGVQQIGAPQAWKAGLNGAGVTVGVMDSGADITHPDLAGRVAAQVDFTPVGRGGEPTTENVHDDVGHGTHVSSILAGTGAASDGRYRGVAPGARLVSAKVGDFDEITESAVIQAMEWAARVEHAKVVNMSLGFSDSPGADAMETALNELTAKQGTLFVTVAGNEGLNGHDPISGSDYQINSPGSAASALTVGAVDHDDRLADFSSRGPGLDDNKIKPDITAPGVDITGALGKDAGGDPIHPGYTTGYGTSFAAPHVAGAAAILAQQHSDWTPVMLKSALMGSARPADGVGPFAQGAGRVDVPAALAIRLLADPPSLSLGTQRWPHTDGTPITKTVTYRNVTTKAARVALRLVQPGSLLSLSATSMTVPAGATAQVRVTAAASTTARDGVYSGQLIATTAGRRTTTPVALVREAESFDLTVSHVERGGVPTSGFATQVIGLDTPFRYDSFINLGDGSNGFTLRVPRGRYAIVSRILSWDAEAPLSITVIAQPSLAVTSATHLTLDARAGQPVRVTAPEAGAQRAASAVDVAVRSALGWTVQGAAAGGRLQPYTVQLGDDGPDDAFVSVVRTALTAGATSYQLAWTHRGTLPTGPAEQVATGELATEKVAVLRQLPGSVVQLDAGVRIPGIPQTLTAIGTSSPVTTRRFGTGGGVRWVSQVSEVPDGDEFGDTTVLTVGQPMRYEPGRTYSSVWNAPVIAPCLTPDQHLTWTGDQLRVRVPMACDSAGHAGTTQPTGGTTTLYRGGAEVASADLAGHATFRVKQARGGYRLSLVGTRSAPFETSIRTTTDWTFTDLAAASELYTVAVTPEAGRVRLATAGRATSVSLAVSYDDGATWLPATVIKTGTGRYVSNLTPPKDAVFVSLRTTASGGGSAVAQSSIRAYPVAR